LDRKATLASFSEVQDAVQSLGPKAVPYLSSVLEREPTGFQQWYAKARPRFPRRLQNFAPPPKDVDQRRAWAAAALMQAGTNAMPVVPLLIRTAQDDAFLGTRHNAVLALAVIAPGTAYEAEATAAVISRTTDAYVPLRLQAYRSLGAFTNQMQRVVPILVHALRNPTVKDDALAGLRRLGTNALPEVKAAAENERFLPMSLDQLYVELAKGPLPSDK
jgi:hypothetical protein